MRYALAILTRDNTLHACHRVANSQDEAVLGALKSLDLYDGEPLNSVKDYLYDKYLEVDLLSIEGETEGCVLATYDKNNNLAVDYYENQTSYEAIVQMLGNFVTLGGVKNLTHLVEFIEDLDMLVDSHEVEYHD
jgi:hypothetical protein